MKKFLLIFLISFFIFPFISLAKGNDIKVESIEFVKKSENAEELTNSNINDNKINIDLKLYDPGDYVEYSIKIKNVSSKEYSFDESKMITSDDYVTYEFSYSESSNVLKPGDERVLKLKVSYNNKVPSSKLENSEYSSSSSIALTLVEDNIVPIINPATGAVNPIIYLLVLMVSAISLCTLLKISKKYKILLFSILITFLVPIYTFANDKVDVDINAKIVIDGKEAYFLPGPDFQALIMDKVGYTMIDGYDDKVESYVEEIMPGESLPANNTFVVSTDESPFPIYMWFENGVLYWWSEDKTPNLNENARLMFNSFIKLKNVKHFYHFDASNVKIMRSFLSDCPTLETLEGLENWDVSNVESLQLAFGLNSYLALAGEVSHLKSIKALQNWNTKSLTSIRSMLNLAVNLESLEGLENWDLSNVENMYMTFANCRKISSLKPLSKWNTSRVQDMSYAFTNTIGLKNLEGLESWDTSSVTNFKGMFQTYYKELLPGEKPSLQNLDALSKWNTSNVTDFSNMFQDQTELRSIEGVRKWDLSKASTIGRMFQVTDYAPVDVPLYLEDISPLKDWNVSGVTNINMLLLNRRNLTSLNDLGNWDVSLVQNFNGFCKGCKSLTEVDNFANWNVLKGTDFTNMLNGAESITELDLSNFDVSNVTATSKLNMINQVTSLTKIKTPKEYPENVSIKFNLSGTFKDEDGNTYTKLDNTSPKGVWLTKVE